MQKTVYDIVVIGSGPAGLTAAIYAARGAASTLVLGGSSWGGQLMLTTLVENYPGFPNGVQGPKLMEDMKTQAVRFGAQFKPLDATKVNLKASPFEIKTSQEDFLGSSIIITTGASTVWLEVPGVKEFIGRGVSSCATCDAPFFRDKKVAVVGGGDTAMEEALYLVKFVSEITIIHRREEFRASKMLQEKILNHPKVKILWNTEVTKVSGDQSVKSIDLKNNKTSESFSLTIDGVFIAIGHKPESGLFTNQLEIDERGFIKITEPHAKTSQKGVFVAGDVMDPYYKQAITAAGSGCAAAMEALEYLSQK